MTTGQLVGGDEPTKESFLHLAMLPAEGGPVQLIPSDRRHVDSISS